MKVLWFEVTPPSRYKNKGVVLGGWQDALENIVRPCQEIELYIAFESSEEGLPLVVDGVTYIPISVCFSNAEKRKASHYWEISAEKLLPELRRVLDVVHPDIVHVFGTEWPFGLVAELTTVAVVIHIQGSIVFYNNSTYPPGYSLLEELRCFLRHPKKTKNAFIKWRQGKSRERVEKRVWGCVENYMGRTLWDEAMSAIMHPNRNYFHVDEALRDAFLNAKQHWVPKDGGTVKLVSTGCSTFWKGPDMLLKTAKILTELGVDFEWSVAGMMPKSLKRMVEWKEKAEFERYNVKFLGFIGPDHIADLLLESTLYIHTAYVENSPNSICEAEILGVPIVSTNVGGISSLVRDGLDGVLVPANDPWQMAYAIINLVNDKERMIAFSNNARQAAETRHNPERIKEQLFNCYNQLLDKENRISSGKW